MLLDKRKKLTYLDLDFLCGMAVTMTIKITSGPNKSPKILFTCLIRSGKTNINIRPIANTHNKLIIKSFKNRIAHLKNYMNFATPKQKAFR